MAEVDTSVPLEQRKVGGLGIHLVKRLVENLTYSYADRNSTITFSKTLET
jgi:anti-sigma regulatory factor (Ser/Thr protein kinase)